jgi:hypothetical protein
MYDAYSISQLKQLTWEQSETETHAWVLYHVYQPT